jgi:HEPN domain-containing protein
MDEATQELVREWLQRAERDLRSARTLASAPDPLLDTAIYHCQQAAEKAIKGWLQARDVPFAKTHDLVELVKLASDVSAEFGALAEAAEVLTPYATAFRYPGGAFESLPSSEEFEDALRQAQTVYTFVLERLPKEVHP